MLHALKLFMGECVPTQVAYRPTLIHRQLLKTHFEDMGVYIPYLTTLVLSLI